MKYRTEKDLLGEEQIPAAAYWGIHTARAKENFCLSGRPVHFDLVRAIALVKKAAALSNAELGFLGKAKADAIVKACDEVYCGKLKEGFIVDSLQGGAGTSTNMNVNEVIANRAIEISGGAKGDHSKVHPIMDVNLHQSTNDVYPTALKVAVIYKLRELSQEIAGAQGAFQEKEKAFRHIVKIGRTELQEAVPMTMGSEFSAFAEAFGRDRWRMFKCEERIRAVNIGGTAVGTGLTAPQKYIFLCIEKLRDLTGLGLSRAENLVDATANSDSFVEVSGMLKAHAQNIIKISGDLRLLHFLGEIRLPEKQAGSSIMPGKVNPVIAEAAIQAGLKMVANDLLVTEAASRGTLQINEFLPLLAESMLESLDLAIRTNRMLKETIDMIQADEAVCRKYVDRSTVIVTAFLPAVGYERALELVKEYQTSGNKSIREFLAEKLGRELVDKTLSPENLMSLGFKHG